MARWGMVIDLDKCAGCQACTLACMAENNIPHGSPEDHEWKREVFWHKVIAITEGHYPDVKVTVVPMPCMHCEYAPCIRVCPVQATYHRPDGIVEQNLRRCIGCKYCVVACPYGARNFNFKQSPPEEYHRPDPPPERSVRGPWPFPRRRLGLVEKCTFCFHRIDEGLRQGKNVGTEVVPACVEACPAEARTFGDLDDHESEAAKLSKSKRVIRLMEEEGTRPKVYYLLG